MTTRAWLLLAVLAGCGPKSAAGPATAPSPLLGTWASEQHTVTLRADHQAQFETRRQCARLPCASATVSLGTWSGDGSSLEVGPRDQRRRYQLRVEGDVLELTPADGEPLRLRRQPALALADTSWVADGRSWAFTTDGFERSEPCDSCAEPVARHAGTYTAADGQLDIDYEGGNESFAVLVEGDELVLIGPTETIRYRRAP